MTWKSFIYEVPNGVMEFAMRSATNILADPDNLNRWNKTRSDNCKLCAKPNSPPYKATLFHILNMYETFLGENERSTWRHNSVLNYIKLTLKENRPDHIQVYADLEGHKVNVQTIPPHIMVTSSRPDLVYLLTVYLFELAVCFEKPGNLEAANLRKYERCTSLSSDIQAAGLFCKNIPFEVGSSLTILHKLTKPRTKYTQFWKNISKTSLLCSYSIFLSRYDPWTGAPYLMPVKQ